MSGEKLTVVSQEMAKEKEDSFLCCTENIKEKETFACWKLLCPFAFQFSVEA